jgi:hypothetical protein
VGRAADHEQVDVAEAVADLGDMTGSGAAGAVGDRLRDLARVAVHRLLEGR